MPVCYSGDLERGERNGDPHCPKTTNGAKYAAVSWVCNTERFNASYPNVLQVWVQCKGACVCALKPLQACTAK